MTRIPQVQLTLFVTLARLTELEFTGIKSAISEISGTSIYYSAPTSPIHHSFSVSAPNKPEPGEMIQQGSCTSIRSDRQWRTREQRPSEDLDIESISADLKTLSLSSTSSRHDEKDNGKANSDNSDDSDDNPDASLSGEGDTKHGRESSDEINHHAISGSKILVPLTVAGAIAPKKLGKAREMRSRQRDLSKHLPQVIGQCLAAYVFLFRILSMFIRSRKFQPRWYHIRSPKAQRSQVCYFEQQ
jgi:hypothetical protein